MTVEAETFDPQAPVEARHHHEPVSQRAEHPVAIDVKGVTKVFETSEQQKTVALQDVSFQVDGFDHMHRTGWSVLVHGRIELVEDADITDVELEPWIGDRGLWVRLVPGVITGRRLVLTLPDVDARGYR